MYYVWCTDTHRHRRRSHMSKNSIRIDENEIASFQHEHRCCANAYYARAHNERGSMNGSLWANKCIKRMNALFMCTYISTMASKIWFNSLFQWIWCLCFSGLESSKTEWWIDTHWIHWLSEQHLCVCVRRTSHAPVLTSKECVITTILHMDAFDEHHTSCDALLLMRFCHGCARAVCTSQTKESKQRQTCKPTQPTN